MIQAARPTHIYRRQPCFLARPRTVRDNRSMPLTSHRLPSPQTLHARHLEHARSHRCLHALPHRPQRPSPRIRPFQSPLASLRGGHTRKFALAPRGKVARILPRDGQVVLLGGNRARLESAPSAATVSLRKHGGAVGVVVGGEGVISPHDSETGVLGGVGLDGVSKRAYADPEGYRDKAF